VNRPLPEIEVHPLVAAVAKTRALLERQGLPESREGLAPLTRLKNRFNLSPFETDVLTLCAAIELDPAIGQLCATLQRDARLSHPTFRLALDAFPDAHWSALLPQGALRMWRLLDVGPAHTLALAPLRIDETVLHFLMGIGTVDERLDPLIETLDPPTVLAGSYRAQAEHLAALWGSGERPAVAILHGNAGADKRLVAASACAAVGLRLRLLRAERVPTGTGERDGLLRLLTRDAILNDCALIIEIDGHEPAQQDAALLLAERFDGALIVSGGSKFCLASRHCAVLQIDRPVAGEQNALWHYALGACASDMGREIGRMAAQFSLEATTILAVGQRVVRRGETVSAPKLGSELWNACREESRPALEGLAQRVVSNVGWDDIVLPEASLETMRAMVAQVRHHAKVLGEWGFGAGTGRGLGTSALFHGHSGTGKTLAAEVLANVLELDLFRIDLSEVVSKYIGETEKNLRAIFDAAENTGAVLLFDEADALFGKRTEVRDSHDRYANIEVSYLLQRMEAYRGLAVMTTNLRGALDPAFLRRIRFVVQFPFPDPGQRRRIWQRMFPASLPTEGIDFHKLAKLNLPGGNIRNIALGAAYLAADAGEPVRMRHLLHAARRECAKLERPLSEAETGGWQ
jgi:ATP-dependent 26S proteasome regulatory subunit